MTPPLSERELLALLGASAVALRANAYSAAAYGNEDKAKHERALARKLHGPGIATAKHLYRVRRQEAAA